MKKILIIVFILLPGLILSGCVIKNDNKNNSMSDQTLSVKNAIIKTTLGDITVNFYAQESPKTVENFINLTKQGFYDNTKFHRVIDGFMIQGGDPLSKTDNKNVWGTGGPGYVFADEINSKKLVRGSLAMANAGPNTNGSQFFIVTATETPWLDGKHTNFGYVTKGMEVVLEIEKTVTDEFDRPVNDIEILSITINE